MKIECILHREGGTKVNLGGVDYHFAPLEDGAHVADVEREDHQDRFLGISEAYRLYRGEKSVDPSIIADTGIDQAPVMQVTETNILLGSSVHPASFDINGKTYSLGDVVAMAAQGFDPNEWNELSDDARHDLIDEQLDILAAEGGDHSDIDADELAGLREQFKAKFGRLPHPSMKADSLKAKLAE